MRAHLTYRGQLVVMAARHREMAQAWDRNGVVLLSDGTQALRMADPRRASRHRQCLALIGEQLARLAKEARS